MRAYRGADIDSDHRLVIAKLRARIARVRKHGPQRQTRFDIGKLSEEQARQKFAVTLSNRFQALSETEDGSIEKKWQRVKESYVEASKEELGYKEKKYKSWLSQDTIRKIEDRRQIWEMMQCARTRLQKLQAQKDYNEKKKEVKKSVRKDKRDIVNKLATEAQEAADKNDQRTLYEITRRLAGKKYGNTPQLKDADGITITKVTGQLDRWKEYFQILLNGTPVEAPPHIEEGNDLNINLEPITKEEIEEAIRKLKYGKAPGPDSIPSEALKAHPATSTDILHDLLGNIWEKEEVPDEWREGYIVKIPKKGDSSQCQNWRGIQLLSVPSKIFSRIVLGRIKFALDKMLRKEQAGFRQNRSCIDHIASLRIIVEQSLEWQSSLYMNFIDFKKAFDMVDREVLWKILRYYGLPIKIVNIIRSLYTNTRCRVIHNSDLTESFEVKTGVRQGCLLSPLLFSLVIDWVMKSAMSPPRGIQWNIMQKLEDLDFADDICLLSHTRQHMQEKTTKLQEIAGLTGLEINTHKTKTMRIEAKQTTSISLNGQPIEEVDKFTYLGSCISRTGGTKEDIEVRINKARYAFISLKNIWRDSNIRTHTKLQIFKTTVISVLLYGSETWRLIGTFEQKLQKFVNKSLRYILGVKWPDTISNQLLLETTKMDPIIISIKKRKWKWIGHTLRREQNNIARQALEWNPQGQRKVGRPITTWRRTIVKELEMRSMSWVETKRRALDRQEWKSVVLALCSDRNV